MKTLVTFHAATALLCSVLASSAFAQGSMLRISCEGESAGAEVSVNGQFKGECPLDMQVEAGSLKLQVVKALDAGRVRVFEQEMRIGDGIVKRVEVVLGAPLLTAEGRKLEAERIRREQAEALVREEERRKAAAEAKVALDKHVDELLQAQRARRTVESAECPDCPPLVLPLAGKRKSVVVPKLSKPELEGWARAIERELAAYVSNPQETFRLPAQAQALPCDNAATDVRRIAGLVSLADETPEKRAEYRALMASVGGGEATYYFRDVRLWPVQMTCKNDKLDGPVDVWVYSLKVMDDAKGLLVRPRLDHLQFTAVDGEQVGPMHRTARTNNGVTEYKDAAMQKMMSEANPSDSEIFSFSYRDAGSIGTSRSVEVLYSTSADSKSQDANDAMTFATIPMGSNRAELLMYLGLRLSTRARLKDGKHHGPSVSYPYTIKTGFLVPNYKVPESVNCYRDGVLIQADPCNVE